MKPPQKSADPAGDEPGGISGPTGNGTGGGQTGDDGSSGDSGTTQPAPAVPDNSGDRAVLEAVYRATGGPSWDADARANWLSDRPMGQWAGVTTEGGYVTRVDLGSSGLSGQFPERLGHLTRLQSANLRGNELTGCIPAGTRLRNALARSYDAARGPGTEPGWDLVILHAIHDVLIEEFGLEAIRTSEESLGWQDFLDGTYGLGLAPCPPPPPARGIVPYARQYEDTDREALLAVRDHFVGIGTPASSFESWQGDMQSDNRLIEPLRQGWRGVTLDRNGRVVKLWLDERQLRGDLPKELGSLGQLVELNLSKNELTGSIPVELGHLRNLRLLALNQNFTPKSGQPTNGLRGRLPPELGNLGELRRLALDDNPFLTGELPLELGNLTNLEHIQLQDTGFSGCLPPPIRQNFSPTLASLLNEVLQELTIGKVKLLMTDEIYKVATARGFAKDVDSILEYHDESFNLYMLYAPLNDALDEVSRLITVVSLDTLIKPGSTLSNLGNVRLTC